MNCMIDFVVVLIVVEAKSTVVMLFYRLFVQNCNCNLKMKLFNYKIVVFMGIPRGHA